MAYGETYDEFVEKFKPKKTTDDCYTPPLIYDTVCDYVEERYGLNRTGFIRPFWPGADYTTTEYPDGCVVVDNPPFSILSKIIAFYVDNGVKFFLFSPYLTAFSSKATSESASVIVCDLDITYENGARVGTCFVTNLETCRFRSAPDLYLKLKAADETIRREKKKELPKYSYPENLCTVSMVGYMSKHGVEFEVRREDSYHVGKLDAQKPMKKAIFGNGYLLSDKAAAEKAAAEKAAAEKAAAEKAAAEKAAAEKAAAEKAAANRFPLSEREWEIVRRLGNS